jgi:cytochrome c oxidase cbb3-type subunit 3
MPGSRERVGVGTTTFLFLLCQSACRQEDRPFRPDPASAEAVRWTSLSELYPGPVASTDSRSLMVRPIGHVKNPYEEGAYAVSEGKRLYSAFNCVGCHARGGGGIGPPLMDDSWLYGHEPEQIFSTIVEGRPNGMPTFGGKIPAYQIWWLVAYVRSMSGLGSGGAAPGRSDEMKSGSPENSRDPEQPVNASLPKSAEIPQ